jgi:hypothetical protein
MPKHLNPFFNEFRAEAELITIMLAGYNELEFDLGTLLGYALGDINKGMRVFYRLRSEAQRLSVADALIRPQCEAANLSEPYEATYSAVFWCKNVRNQYAHSQWTGMDGGLRFSDLEEHARTKVGELNVKLKGVDVPLLQKQVEYFHYAADWLMYLRDEYSVRTGQLSSHDTKVPTMKPQPRKYGFRAGHDGNAS